MKKNYRVIGAMSGTSLDGLDLCYCDITTDLDQQWEYAIIHCQTLEFTTNIKQKLEQAAEMSGRDLSHFDNEFGEYIGKQILLFCQEFKIDILKDIHFIASHGHTVFHEPDKKFTYQIGDLSKIAATTGQIVIGDFRSMDTSLSGEGAPLVPIGDRLFFKNYQQTINLGGISNITQKRDNNIAAFDICPANMALNFLAQKKGLDFDKNGYLASTGSINSKLLDKLNALSFYSCAPPKSLGREWVEKNIFTLLENTEDTIANKLHTFCHHIALQISKITNSKFNNGKILISGGGAKNMFLMSCIKEYVNAPIETNSTTIVDFKEALIFALLGVLRINNIPNTIQSVTGAKYASIGGGIYNGKEVRPLTF